MHTNEEKDFPAWFAVLTTDNPKRMRRAIQYCNLLGLETKVQQFGIGISASLLIPWTQDACEIMYQLYRELDKPRYKFPTLEGGAT